MYNKAVDVELYAGALGIVPAIVRPVFSSVSMRSLNWNLVERRNALRVTSGIGDIQQDHQWQSLGRTHSLFSSTRVCWSISMGLSRFSWASSSSGVNSDAMRKHRKSPYKMSVKMLRHGRKPAHEGRPPPVKSLSASC
jgi:hypothetical protein